MRDTDGPQTLINLGPVNRDGQTLALELGMERTLSMPDPGEHLPDRIEACVHRAGLELQRRLFRALLETADPVFFCFPARRKIDFLQLFQ